MPRGRSELANENPSKRAHVRAAPRPAAFILAPAIVVLATFCAFARSLAGGFVTFDDYPTVVENPHLREFTAANLGWMFTTNLLGHYQPLSWLTLALNYRLCGPGPFSFHLLNLILHCGAALVCYFVARRIIACATGTRSSDPALVVPASVAALLFAVHPLRVESVAWVTERRDVLSVFLLLLSVLCYLRHADASRVSGQRRRDYVLSLMFLTLSLLAKAWGLSLFLVFLVLDVYPLRRLTLRAGGAGPRGSRTRVLLEKVPYLGLGIAAAGLAFWAQRFNAAATLKTIEQWPLHVRLAQACYGFVFYLQKTLLPTNLSPLYEIPNPLRVDAPEMLAAYAILCVIVVVAAALAAFRRAPAVLAALAIYAIIFAPVSGVAQSGPQLVADRYSYVSCIPFAILAGGLLALVQRRAARSAAVACRVLAGAGIATCLLLSVLQTRVWLSSESFWNAVLERWPGSIAAKNVGDQLLQLGDAAGAERLYRASLAYNSELPDASFSLANLLKSRGADPEAEQRYRDALRNAPIKLFVRVNLGNLYLMRLNRADDAIIQFRAAIEEMRTLPQENFSALPYLSLGVALRQTGDTAGARVALEVALKYPLTAEHARNELASMTE